MVIGMTKIRKFKTENYVERLFCDCGTELIYQFCKVREDDFFI